MHQNRPHKWVTMPFTSESLPEQCRNCRPRETGEFGTGRILSLDHRSWHLLYELEYMDAHGRFIAMYNYH